MIAELFAQMDGGNSSNKGIFILAATSTPYDLDEAIMHRFDRLFHVALPDDLQRYRLFKKMLTYMEDGKATFSEKNFETLSQKTKG